MKITIESTNTITTVSGQMCRIWQGVTESGIKCDVAVPMIRVLTAADTEEFVKELIELPQP